MSQVAEAYAPIEAGTFRPTPRTFPEHGVPLDVVHGSGSAVAPRTAPRVVADAFGLKLGLAFSVVSLLAFVFSNLAGNVMLEQARREANSYSRQTVTAEASVKALSHRVRFLAQPDRMATWAAERGLVAPDQQLHPSE